MHIQSANLKGFSVESRQIPEVSAFLPAMHLDGAFHVRPNVIGVKPFRHCRPEFGIYLVPWTADLLVQVPNQRIDEVAGLFRVPSVLPAASGRDKVRTFIKLV